MKTRTLKAKEVVQMALFLVFFAFTVAINLNCSEENPVKGPECGSGKNVWYDKAQVCRDEVTNQVVPSSCCGRE